MLQSRLERIEDKECWQMSVQTHYFWYFCQNANGELCDWLLKERRQGRRNMEDSFSHGCEKHTLTNVLKKMF